MIGLLAFTLALSPVSEQDFKDCADPATEQEKVICEYLKRIENLEIRTVESVAVGTEAEMRLLRPVARGCNLINRIDYVSREVSVFDVVNAEQAERNCLVSWIEANEPQLAFSEIKLQRLIEASSPPENMD